MLVQIVSFLPSEDFKQCYNVSKHWRCMLNNLPPNLCPLPDQDFQRPGLNSIPQSVRTVMTEMIPEILGWADIKQRAQAGEEMAIKEFADLNQDALRRIHEVLSPCLHPFLAGHAWIFVQYLEKLAAGELQFKLRTRGTMRDFLKILSCEDGCWEKYLIEPPSKAVEVYLFQGALWNGTYANALSRGEESCVRIEREKGVRMADVLEELNCLLCILDMDNLDTDLELEFRFNNA